MEPTLSTSTVKPGLWFRAAGLSVIGLALLGWVARLHYGVDVTDEAWYIGTAYRFLLGDRPYLDEIYLMQGFALFTFPIFKLFGFGPGAEGMVLFGRGIYAFFNLIVGSCIAWVLRRRVPALWQLACVAAWVLFLPYGIPNVSYNTLGLGFLALSFCSAFERSVNGGPVWLWFVAGLALGAAVVSHVSLLVSTAVFIMMLPFLEQHAKKTAVALFTLGVLGSGIGVLILYSVTFAQLKHNYALTLLMNTAFNNRPNLSKVFRVFSTALGQSPVILGPLLLALQHRRFRQWRGWVCAATTLFLIPYAALVARAESGGMGAHGVTIYVGMLAPFIVGFLDRSRLRDALLLAGWLPAMVAAFSIATTSYNGLPAAGVPALLGSLTTLILLFLWGQQELPHWAVTWRGKLIYEPPLPLRAVFTHVPVLLWIALFSHYDRNNLYFEDPIATLTQRIATGPFRGLYTSAAKGEDLDLLQSVLNATKSTGTLRGRLLIYPLLPAAYLMAQSLPLLPTVWGCMGLPPSVCHDYARSKRSAGDIWIRVNRLYLYQGRIQESPGLEYWDTLLVSPPVKTAAFERVVPKYGY